MATECVKSNDMRVNPLHAFVFGFVLAIAPGVASAHPMGNLSINHYARLEAGANGIHATYVLDIAELPTFELMQTWGTPQGTAKAVLDRKAAVQAREWIANLSFLGNGKPLTPTVESTDLAIIDGAGNLPVFRIRTNLHLPAAGGRLEYEDRNYPTRAGWREIVVVAGSGAEIQKASNGDQDISQGLTSYPQDPTKAPPQDTRAWIEWRRAPLSISKLAKPIELAAAPVATTVRDVRPAEPQSLGTVKRNDAISQILRRKDISWPLLVTLIALAFWFGALHALEPGHGKTMVAAYLVGERGTPRHAVFLGGMVTFTHTISVFILGLATMFLSRYIMPEKISKVLGIVSGLSIVWIGGMLLWRRAQKLRTLRKSIHAHSHGHHDHEHAHPHSHTHDHHHHDHGHTHTHAHTHDGHTHSHVPKGDISLGSLIALGASGGLVPCPSALILLLSAISIGRPGLGLVLLIAFSIGLAIVLMATGLAVLYAKNLLPRKQRADNLVFRYMPVVSAAAILMIGLVMTSVSLGWIPATRFLS
jgi:nickel/cobalt transporter (NicO) family protein